MSTKVHETRYECSDCGNSIHPVSYRAACPDCGGQLRTIQRLQNA